MNNRSLLNLLAGLLLLIGTAMALGNLWFLAAATNLSASLHARLQASLPMPILITLGATLTTLGLFVAHRAWTHLRRPNAATARDVISFGIYLAAFAALMPFLRHHAYLTIASVIALALLRLYLTKRFANQFAGVR
jgi:hypothetical protein